MKLDHAAVERVVEGDAEARAVVARHLATTAGVGADAMIVQAIDDALAAALRRGLMVAATLHDVDIPRAYRTPDGAKRALRRGSLADLVAFVAGKAPDNRTLHPGTAPVAITTAPAEPAPPAVRRGVSHPGGNVATNTGTTPGRW